MQGPFVEARAQVPQDGGAPFGVQKRRHQPEEAQPPAVKVEQVEGDLLLVGNRCDDDHAPLLAEAAQSRFEQRSSNGVENEVRSPPARGPQDDVCYVLSGGINDNLDTCSFRPRTLRFILDGTDDAGALPASDHRCCAPHAAGSAGNEDHLLRRDVTQLDKCRSGGDIGEAPYCRLLQRERVGFWDHSVPGDGEVPGMGPVADEPELPTARAPNLLTNEFRRSLDDGPGEVAPRYARQGSEGERASCVQHIAAVYSGGVDFYKDLPFRRIWPRDFGRSEFRRIPEVFDQDGLHFAIHLHESSENSGYLPHYLERSLHKELVSAAPLEERGTSTGRIAFKRTPARARQVRRIGYALRCPTRGPRSDPMGGAFRVGHQEISRVLGQPTRSL